MEITNKDIYIVNYSDIIQNKVIHWSELYGKSILVLDQLNKKMVLQFLSYDSKKQTIYLKLGNEVFSILCDRFKQGYILSTISLKLFKYKMNEVLCTEAFKCKIIDRFKIGEKKFYKIRCLNCDYETVVDEFMLTSLRFRCPACCNSKAILGVNDIATTSPWMVEYFQNGIEEAQQYVKQSNAEIYFKCPYCQEVSRKARPIYQLYNSKTLPCTCKDNISYPEKFFRLLLDDNNVDYIYQLNNKDFTWVGNYRYDFYLPQYNLILETHGQQHYDRTFGKISVEKQQMIDNQKRNLAFNNGIFKYYEIDCRISDCDYIANNLSASGLLTDINISLTQEKIIFYGENAHKNIVKDVCDYFENNPNLTSSQLGEIFHLNITTILKYLKIGNKYGWCKYNSTQSLRKGQITTKNIMIQRRLDTFGLIEVYNKENDLIGQYLSQREASKELSKLGYDISPSNVSNALKSKHHLSKGLYFYYSKIRMEGDYNESN